jgi:hypothetical protein
MSRSARVFDFVLLAQKFMQEATDYRRCAKLNPESPAVQTRSMDIAAAFDKAAAMTEAALREFEATEKDDQLSAMWNQAHMSAADFEKLKDEKRAEADRRGLDDFGCGHGAVRFPFDKKFTPCFCGSIQP